MNEKGYSAEKAGSGSPLLEEDALRGQQVEVTVFVSDDLGLHARPAARIVRAAGRFASICTLSQGSESADAKSILEILSLSAPADSPLILRCLGPDAAEAAAEISRQFQNLTTSTETD